MKRACEQCGRDYAAKTGKSRFCSAACRQKASRIRTKNDGPQRNDRRNAHRHAEIAESGEVAAATREALDEVGVTDSPLGKATLALARRLDGGATMTGSALASVAREFRATLPLALASGKAAADPLDQIAERRVQRRRRA